MRGRKKDSQTKQVTKEIRKERRAQEREVFQSLHGKQKLIHFLTYYRGPVIGTCVGIFVIVSLVMAVVNGNGKIGLYCMLFTDSTADYTSWGDSLMRQAEPLDGEGFFEQLAYFTSADDPMKGVAENYLATRIGVHEADVFIGGDYFFEYAGEELAVLMPLSEVFDEQELKEYEGRIVCTSDGIPRGIALTEEEFPEVSEKPYYAMVCDTTGHLEQSKRFMEGIFKNTQTSQ